MRIGRPDPSLTGLAGLAAVEELVGAPGVVGELDRAVGPINARARGATGGQLLVGLATAQLSGQDCLAGLDRVRADPGSALLRSAPVPAATTAAQLACRFGPSQLAGIEAGLSAVYSRWLSVLPAQLRGRLVLTDPTIDLDATAVWRAAAAIDESAWRDAPGMPSAQVAACDYAPAGWPPGTYTIVRRVKISAELISRDPRSRRRRTIPKDQLTLALDGAAGHAYAHSFIVTNIPADDGDVAGLEAWFRRRTSIEDRFREGKHGGGLHHLPSGQASINTIWAWGALLAGALNTMLQPLTGRRPDHAMRTRTPTVRHQLLALPGRILRHARGITLRLGTTGDLLLPPAPGRPARAPATRLNPPTLTAHHPRTLETTTPRRRPAPHAHHPQGPGTTRGS